MVVLLEIHKNDFMWIFNFNYSSLKANLNPLKMIKNLSDMRTKSQGEYINKNKTISRMIEN